jgi:hypothetical protein
MDNTPDLKLAERVAALEVAVQSLLEAVKMLETLHEKSLRTSAPKKNAILPKRRVGGAGKKRSGRAKPKA